LLGKLLIAWDRIHKEWDCILTNNQTIGVGIPCLETSEKAEPVEYSSARGISFTSPISAQPA
jgi:hypothetical protein